jgi:hypothetical protein
MASIDTFQLVIKETFPRPDEHVAKMIEEKREYLFSLRSEDERQRFVDELAKELYAIVNLIRMKK